MIHLTSEEVENLVNIPSLFYLISLIMEIFPTLLNYFNKLQARTQNRNLSKFT